MKNKHWQYILLLLFFTVALDFSLGKLYETLYFSEENIKNDKMVYSILEMHEDVLIFGSSRAMHHYNPKIMKDSLKMTCFNAGIGGQNIYFHLAILEYALEKFKPKIVILDVMSIDFTITPPEWDTEKLSSLLPFYKKSDAFKQAVKRRGNTEQYKLLSHIYPYNSLIYQLLRSNFLSSRKDESGFIPLDRIWNRPIEKVNNEQISIDENKVIALKKFCDISTSRGVETYLIVSPHYVINTNESVYDDILKQLGSKYNISIISYEQDSSFINNQKLFADPLHLNLDGANKLSSKTASFILETRNR